MRTHDDPEVILARLTSPNGSTPGKGAYVHCADGGSQVPDFPVSVLPDAIRRYVEEGATALNVPADMIALPLLGFAAAAIGNTIELVIKPTWIERPSLWIAVIGDPGSGKSPAVSYAQGPLDALQRRAHERFQSDVAAWEDLAEMGRKDKTIPVPDRPVYEHFYSTDVTTEKLAAILATSPGVAVVRDELTGWVKSHDAYRQAGDRQHFLTLWAGSPLKVDRKGSDTIHVPRPCVPIIGGIQPDLLPDLAEEASRRDGFIERILMTWPVSKPMRWSDVPVDTGASADVHAIFARLRQGDTNQEPTRVLLSAESRQLFGRWYDENGAIVDSTAGLAQGFYAKFPGQLGRLALVLHVLRNAETPGRPLTVETMSDAITLIEYFRSHLVRILPRFDAIGSTKGAALGTRILRVLGRADGEWVARRELRRGLGNSVPAEDIATVLDLLEQEGTVETRTVETGARPREEARIPPAHNAHMHHSAEVVPTVDLAAAQESAAAGDPVTLGRDLASVARSRRRSPVPKPGNVAGDDRWTT